MAINMTFIIIAAAIGLIWVFVEIGKVKYKLIAILLIGLALFTYFTVSSTFKEEEVDLTSVGGIITAGKVYMSWLGNTFDNLKSISAFAIKQNWTNYNKSVLDSSNESFLEKTINLNTGNE